MMKLKKKTALLLSFALGGVLFTTTALADIASKSGYDQLKDSLKFSSHNMAKQLDSFTMDLSYVLRDNGQVRSAQTQTTKYDMSAGAREITSQEEAYGDTHNNYGYQDKAMTIYLDEQQDTYYVTEYTSEQNPPQFDDLFQEERMADVEKIADALVGSLKDHVVVTDRADGKKELSGALTEIQIPTLINAVSSFYIKQEFSGYDQRIPNLNQDIFIKGIEGKVVTDSEGQIESISGAIHLSGKDKDGQVHDITLEILGELKDVNATSVKKPDLSGKQVVRSKTEKRDMRSGITNPQKYVGKFQNDIVIVENNTYVKIGEQVIEITFMDGQTVKGTYSQTYKPGYEEYAIDGQDFSFEGRFTNDPYTAQFEKTDGDADRFDGIYFDDWRGKLYLNGSQVIKNGVALDYEFRMVLD